MSNVVEDLVDQVRFESDRRAAVVQMRTAGLSWRAIGQALEVDHGWLHRKYGQAAAVALVPAPRAAEPAAIGNVYTRSLLDVSRRQRETGACFCGEVDVDPARHMPCAGHGVVASSSGWLSVQP